MTQAGGDLTSETARCFRQLTRAVGIGTAPGRPPARLGDLRHSFAVHTLLSWHGGGVDVQRHLPVLSAYLGHNQPAHTYWYLEAVPELMAMAAQRLESFGPARP
jgi:hypothetical protein